MSVNKRHREDREFRGASIRGSLRDRGRRYSSHVLARRESARGVDAAIRRPSLAAVVERGSWGSRWEFLLSCVGLSVGIGNVWRFPYLAYQNGGGAFLIPYLIMMVLIGKPMYFLELAVGQFAGVGPIALWNCCPLMRGVGFAMVTVSLIVCIYYNVIMSYTVYYMVASFSSEVPWKKCDPAWANMTTCYVRDGNVTEISAANNNHTNQTIRETASLQYWERHVLRLSDGIEDIGPIKWDLALCLLLSWTIVVLCLVKGIKTSGKVVYFAATFPYVILLILLVTGLMQEGAMTGVKYFLMPQWDKLLNIQVWQAAAGQMFFSLSVSMGGLIMYSSYNDFHNNVYTDAVVVSVLDTATSMISGLVTFSILGATAHDLQVNISSVVKEGPGLAFVAYPEALLRLPIPQLWSVLFFLMLFVLGLDSEFALLENVLTSVADVCPTLRNHKLIFCIITAAFCYLVGLSCVTYGGSYILTLMDVYGGGMAVLCIAIAECIGLQWIYGFLRLRSDLGFMLGAKPNLYWIITWVFFSPVLLACILGYSIYEYKPVRYETYDYPDWADAVGWSLCAFSIIQIPIVAIITIIMQSGGNCIERLIKATTPNEDWGPSDADLREQWIENRDNTKTQKRKQNRRQTNGSTTEEVALASPVSPPIIQLNHVTISAVPNGQTTTKEYL